MFNMYGACFICEVTEVNVHIEYVNVLQLYWIVVSMFITLEFWPSAKADVAVDEYSLLDDYMFEVEFKKRNGKNKSYLR